MNIPGLVAVVALAVLAVGSCSPTSASAEVIRALYIVPPICYPPRNPVIV